MWRLWRILAHFLASGVQGDCGAWHILAFFVTSGVFRPFSGCDIWYILALFVSVVFGTPYNPLLGTGTSEKEVWPNLGIWPG